VRFWKGCEGYIWVWLFFRGVGVKCIHEMDFLLLLLLLLSF
jgi:hypothetical protein